MGLSWEEGITFDKQGIGGIGYFIGAAYGLHLNIEATTASAAQDLRGLGWQAGVNVGEAAFLDIGAMGGEGYVGASIGAGIGGGTPAAGYMFNTFTWEQGGPDLGVGDSMNNIIDNVENPELLVPSYGND